MHITQYHSQHLDLELPTADTQLWMASLYRWSTAASRGSSLVTAPGYKDIANPCAPRIVRAGSYPWQRSLELLSPLTRTKSWQISQSLDTFEQTGRTPGSRNPGNLDTLSMLWPQYLEALVFTLQATLSGIEQCSKSAIQTSSCLSFQGNPNHHCWHFAEACWYNPELKDCRRILKFLSK